MALICPGCGFDAPADFAFCPKCGKPLTAPAPTPSSDTSSDRRPVTVLFADLCGFTALSETLDPEDVRALQGELFALMSSAIQRLDGFVEKYVGDAVMAVFGAPVAHEEDPERAVRAALELHERVARLSARWLPLLGRPLALHVGINTGPVVAGHIGSQREGAYAVTGDTVNAASRLQNAAGPGQTFVSEATWLLTRHAFRYEPMGGLALKGKAQPLPAYRVEGALQAPASARGLQAHGLAAPMIGRDAELGALMAAFAQMQAGQTQLVRIVAEAGSGKSRLLSEFLARLQANGQLADTALRSAACSSLGERTYGVPAALLRDAYGLAADENAATARQKIAAALAALGAGDDETARISLLLGYVLGFDPDEARTRHLDPEQLKHQIFLAVQSVVERRLQAGALLLVVEDLHWTDAASVELLRALLDRLPARRFMLLVTQRPAVELDVLAAGALPQTLLLLQPLSATHSASLLDALFGTDARTLPAALQQRIVEHAGGNPLFLEEMVRTLIVDGALHRERERWVLHAQAAALNVPQTIHGLLLGRIDRLPPPARQAMQEAAVIGPQFAEDLLREVASDAPALPDALRVLQGAGLLERSEGDYRFRHGLIHEVAYGNLLARRRSELHTRVGEVLERRCGGVPHQLQELQALGHHFRLGADKPRGARYLVAAGDWARGIYANADAIRHYELALQTLHDCGDPQAQSVSVRERLADVMVPAGHIADAAEHYEAVREALAQMSDEPAQARVLRKLSGLRWEAGERGEALRCLEQGLALAERGPAHIECAKLYQERGQLAFRSGDNLGALQWTQRALQHIEGLAAHTDDERRDVAAAVAFSLNTVGAALARLDRLDEAVTQLERSVTVARDAELPQAECRALSNLGVLYSSRDPQRAIDACERGLHTAQRIGDLGLQSRLYANLAVAYCTLTNRCDDRGVGAANSAIRIDRSTGQLDHLAVSLVVLGQIYQCHGDPRRALGFYQEALALAEKSGEPQLLFPCYDGLATLHLDRDELEEAERYMALAKDTCERAGLDPDALVVLPFLA
jgi:adenylate cyclase